MKKILMILSLFVIGLSYHTTDDYMVEYIVEFNQEFDILSTNLDIEIVESYDAIFDGVSIKTSYKNLEQIENLNEVSRVFVVETFEMIEVTSSDSESSIYDTTLLENQGENTIIAILDNGFNVSHEAFSSGVDDAKMSKSDITSAFSSSYYYNEKIPFCYDYAGNDFNVYLSSSNHGTHVAGIAAGNSNKLKGSASQAQLALMKVFNDYSVSSMTYIVKALDDCVKLDVDVINISLGSSAGFSIAGDNTIDDIFELVVEKNISLNVAVGNSGSNPFDTSYADNGLLGAPSSYYGVTSIANGTVDGICDSSMWGVTPNLKLEPDIVAPGQNIYSSYNSGYGYLSGTSMATPNFSGISAVLRKYLVDNSLNEESIAGQVDQILMSTTDIIYDGDLPITVRQQGSGVANINNALDTNAYLNVSGQSKTKLELFDSVDGSYSFSFNVNNISNTTVTYSIEDILFTYYQSSTSLSSDITYIYNNQEISSITVEPYSTKTIECSLTLNDNDKKYIEDTYENGWYVEGFILLTSSSNVDLSIPLLGFYGDWTVAPIFDNDVFEGTGIVYTSSIKGAYQNRYYDLGVCRYDSSISSRDNLVISDDFVIKTVNVGLLRNAQTLEYTLKNNTTNTTMLFKTLNYVSKTYDSDSYLSVDLSSYKFVEGNEYEITFKAKIDYNQSEYNDIQSFKFSVDNVAPVIETYNISYEDDKILLNLNIVEENLQCVKINDDVYEVSSSNATIDITNYTQINVIVEDYAFNQTTMTLDLREFSANTQEYILGLDEKIPFSQLITYYTDNIDVVISDDVITTSNHEIYGVKEGTCTITFINKDTNAEISVDIEVQKMLNLTSLSFISKLEEIDNLSLYDKALLEELRLQVDSGVFNDTQLSLLETYLEKLADYEAQYIILYANALVEISSLISSIDEVTLNSESTIERIKELYDLLDEEDQLIYKASVEKLIEDLEYLQSEKKASKTIIYLFVGGVVLLGILVISTKKPTKKCKVTENEF